MTSGNTGTQWWHDGVLAVSTGAAVTDSANLSGDNVSSAGGTVTYTVSSTCFSDFSGSNHGSDQNCSPQVVSTDTVNVSDGVVPDSAPVTLTSPGVYFWQASYSGDAANRASQSPAGSEIEIVTAHPWGSKANH